MLTLLWTMQIEHLDTGRCYVLWFGDGLWQIESSIVHSQSPWLYLQSAISLPLGSHTSPISELAETCCLLKHPCNLPCGPHRFHLSCIPVFGQEDCAQSCLYKSASLGQLNQDYPIHSHYGSLYGNHTLQYIKVPIPNMNSWGTSPFAD